MLIREKRHIVHVVEHIQNNNVFSNNKYEVNSKPLKNKDKTLQEIYFGTIGKYTLFSNRQKKWISQFFI